MGINKPYRRNIRQFIDGEFREGGRWRYIIHQKYANNPSHYVRALLVIQKDLLELFDYVEPADKNKDTYSFRIHELLIRICIEVEANCVAILKENGYTKSGDFNMNDYQKINRTHRLAAYEVKVPIWNGTTNIRKPFANWDLSTPIKPNWYTIYNEVKHDRHNNFSNATFETLIDAMCGLVAIISSQFMTEHFSGTDYSTIRYLNDGMEIGAGGYFKVKYPTDWNIAEKYDFDWQLLESLGDPFQNYSY
jgi:hypothetical protein